MAIEDMRGLFEHDLKDMYFAERKLVKALEKSAKEASDPRLAQAFSEHAKETQEHAKRLEKVFAMIGKSPKAKTCDGVLGLLKEKDGFSKEKPSAEIKDLFDASAGIKVERYEISGYESLIRLAGELDMPQAAALFERTLEEERAALDTLEGFSTSLGAASSAGMEA
jgi:ferritin-like metal-binding protein YciE